MRPTLRPSIDMSNYKRSGKGGFKRERTGSHINITISGGIWHCETRKGRCTRVRTAVSCFVNGGIWMSTTVVGEKRCVETEGGKRQRGRGTNGGRDE
jgi:hypothetical protein